MTQILF